MPALPPPPPDMPVASTSHRKPIEKAPSMDEKVNVWSERISLVTTAVRLQAEIAKIADEERSMRQTMNTTHFETLPERDRTAHMDRLAALARRKQEVERKVQEEVEKLARSDTWPGSPADNPGLHLCNLEMEWTLTVARQRSVGDCQMLTKNVSTIQGQQRLANIEDRLVAFENDMSTLTNDVDNDLGARLEYRLDELLSQKMVDDVGEKLDGVEQKLDLAARDLEEFKEHVAELDSGADDVANGITDLAQTLHQLVEQRLIKAEEFQSNQHAQIQAIQAALAAHMSQPPPQNLPPVPTYPLNSEVIIESLEGLLEDSIRRKVLPSLQKMQTTVEGAVKQRNEELQQVFGKRFELLRMGIGQLEKKILQS
ncbi:hypothetical protein PLEOSDRAFT_1080595 [Pleurotus ostreatus PC15]|uniref:Uncharacterized protein n=1 Tax=Pleurotus ostreatus (strain PC15) TaxID=1137138 RepID=A0A067P242_PLEO1|nr:hypothetical protein PLEOSDRAFT_1080595 [Pleurotus ostreatus PC15]